MLQVQSLCISVDLGWSSLLIDRCCSVLCTLCWSLLWSAGDQYYAALGMLFCSLFFFCLQRLQSKLLAKSLSMHISEVYCHSFSLCFVSFDVLILSLTIIVDLLLLIHGLGTAFGTLITSSLPNFMSICVWRWTTVTDQSWLPHMNSSWQVSSYYSSLFPPGYSSWSSTACTGFGRGRLWQNCELRHTRPKCPILLHFRHVRPQAGQGESPGSCPSKLQSVQSFIEVEVDENEGKTPLWLIILRVSRVLSEVLSRRRPIIMMMTVTLSTGCDVSMVIDIVKAFMSPTLHHSCLLVSCLRGKGDCQKPI